MALSHLELRRRIGEKSSDDASASKVPSMYGL
jgi:hypothetical protein